MADTFQVNSYGDVIISAMSGRPNLITGSQKFSQDMQELLSEDPPVGAGLDRLVGMTPLDPLTLTTSADISVRNAAQRYQTLQTTDTVTPRGQNEILASVSYLEFIQDPNNPTQYLFNIQFVSNQGSIAPLVGVIGQGQTI